jgi:hypothetical protein
MRIVVRGPNYYSRNDEAAMFDWVAKISGLAVEGEGVNLHFELRRRPSNAALRDLIALFYRYRLDMRPLAALRHPTNEHWFAARDSYWFRSVFGRDHRSGQP